VNRSKLSLRRPLTLLGAALLGATVAVAIASPASAHHPTVTGEAVCTSAGTWLVRWQIGNSERDIPGTITAVGVRPEGTKVTGVDVGTEVAPAGRVLGIQVVPGDKGKAELKVSMQWTRGSRKIDANRSGTVEFGGTCTKPSSKPAARFASDCDGVTVTLVNEKDATAPAKFVVTGEGGFKAEETVESGEAQVTVPAKNAGKITVTEDGKKIGEYAWEKPEDCAEPTFAYGSTCDALTFEITNPEGGEPITVRFTPSTGEPKDVTVQPGTTETVEFPASEGLTVTPSIDGESGEPLAWEKPEDCDNGGGGGGDDGGDLPVTGVAATGIAAGALVLLAVGVMMFMIARRRRTTFTV
jgi:hypothetical protein